ncbi:MAG: transposase [Bdellovibrionales bacterium]|nr:transposase [Bdellovibrionales bacterium]
MKKKSENVSLDQGKIVSVFKSLDSKGIQGVMEEQAKRAALAFGLELLELDTLELCGERYKHGGRTYWRYGSEETSVMVGGARHRVRRPRVRGEDGEAELPSLSKLRDQDLLDEEMKEKMLLGVSTRNYSEAIEGYKGKFGDSKSSVSRAFERASKKDLDAINHADLSDYSFVGLVLDGLEIKGRTIVAAVGVTHELEKIPVGLIEGSSENSTVVTDLLQNLLERGFTLHCQRLLCVVDGSKALSKALKSVFGDAVLIQRCWLHKLRNLEGYLPQEKHQELHLRMNRMMNLDRYKEAKEELRKLRDWLMQTSEQAANSLDEAGEELLTLHKLGIPVALRKSLDSTNMIESLFSVVRQKLHNVKNWNSRNPSRKMQWIASAILHHRKRMRKLRGVKHCDLLIRALGVKVDEQKISA